MNLRIDDCDRDERPRYWYFFSYMFSTQRGDGEGMAELCYIERKIVCIEQLREIADYLKENNNKQDITEKWDNVIIRNFIFLREGGRNGIKPREEETSPKDDPEVFKGSQG